MTDTTTKALVCLECDEDLADDDARVVCCDCGAIGHYDCLEGTDCQAEECGGQFVPELALLERELLKVEEVLGKPGGIMGRLFGSGINVAAAQQAIEQAREQLANARRREARRLSGEEEELEQERVALEKARVEVDKRALQVRDAAEQVHKKHAIVRAKDIASLTRIDQAQTLRDGAISGHHTLRSQVLGLARTMGYQGRKPDELAAMRWMMDNVMTEAQLKTREKDVGTSARLLLQGYVAELEAEAAKYRENGQAAIADAFDKLARKWAERT